VFDHKAYTEKSLAKMVKAKAKAERAAIRQANFAQVNMLMGLPPPVTPSSSNLPSEAPTPPAVDQEQEENVTGSQSQPKDSRIDILRSKLEVVSRFMTLMVPILIDVYAASVTTTIRIKTLTGLLKAISFLEPEGAKQVLTVSDNISNDLFGLSLTRRA
jgi:E3 ubiquitin-protein ligase TRIP12